MISFLFMEGKSRSEIKERLDTVYGDSMFYIMKFLWIFTFFSIAGERINDFFKLTVL